MQITEAPLDKAIRMAKAGGGVAKGEGGGTAMSMKGQTLVKGHTLMHEGYPHWPDGIPHSSGGGFGCGKCSCGEMSRVLNSNADRKRWHKQHKAEVLRRMEEQG